MTIQRSRDGHPHQLAVIAAKGGIGQSTVCLDWACALGRRGRQCLLVELAGGDIAWHVGAEPRHFTEDVAGRNVPIRDAVVPIEDNVDLLPTGNEWSLYGPPNVERIADLLDALVAGPWTDVIYDLGDVSRAVAECVLERADQRIVLLHSEIACVARTYALLRMFRAGALAGHTYLVFNRIHDHAEAASLRERFDHLTTRFLSRTWPYLGAIPDAGRDDRVAAIHAWTPDSTPETSSETIINRPVLADNKG